MKFQKKKKEKKAYFYSIAQVLLAYYLIILTSNMAGAASGKGRTYHPVTSCVTPGFFLWEFLLLVP